MSQILTVKARGLYTNNNQLSEVPEGSLSVANNVVINSDSIIESRRGYERSTAFTNEADRADALTNYQDKVVVHRNNDNKLSYFNGTTWVDYTGTYNHPDSALARMKFTQANGNLYFTTSDGVKMLDVVTGSIYSTGLPKGLDGTATLTGASGYLANNTQVAYRVVWGTRDTNNNLYLGSPSQRIIIGNSAGASRDVSLTFTIPAGITTSDFYQVYRSAQSATSTTEPNDEMQLVYEANPTAGEITAKSITFTDSTPDSLKGAFLYTNANQEGISESNNEPPYCTDITNFKNFTFFSGIKTKHQLYISLLSVGGSAGLLVNDTVTVNGMVFTGKAATTVATREFKVFTAGSASQNIDDTARELVKVINQFTGNTSVYSYYISSYTDLPGQILIEQRTITGTSFSVSTSRTTAFDLNGGASTNNDFPNGIMWSKIQQPEHVPNAHLEFIGSKSAPIRRIIALRDSLFVLKDDGVYRMTGENGSWKVELIDSSTKIVAPESTVVMNNQIYCLSDQGVVAISDVGVQIQSRQIEDKISEALAESLDGAKQYSFGVSYETDRKYILYTITNSADTFATQAFIFNTFTQSWVETDKAARTGFINKTDDKLYLASPDSKYLLKERKSFTFRDYVDEEVEGITKLSYLGNIIFLNTVVGIQVGDLVYMSTSVFSPVTEINSVNNSVTVNDTNTWSGAITIFKAIQCRIEWSNQTCGNPGIDKHFQELALLFRVQNFNLASVSFYTDISGGYSNSTITGNYGGNLWGAGAWGALPWSGIIRPRPVRVFINREKSRGTLLSIRFNHRVGFGAFSLNGYSLQYAFVSERMNRV